MYAGIDPGFGGAITVLDGDSASGWNMPTLSKEGGRVLDIAKLWQILSTIAKDGCRFVGVETVHAFPGQRANGTSTALMGYGMIRMGIHAAGMEEILISAGAWRKKFSLEVKAPRGSSKAEKLVAYKLRKQKSIDFVESVYPGVAKKDGQAEATIIAMYVRESLNETTD